MIRLLLLAALVGIVRAHGDEHSHNAATRRGDSVVVRVTDDGPVLPKRTALESSTRFLRQSRLDRASGLAWTSRAGSPT